MEKLKEKIKEIFYDDEELELLNTKIGALRDLCDSKDDVIVYQKKLIETQAETIKTQRLEIDKLRDLEKNMNKMMEEIEDVKKHNTRNKSRK